MINERAIEQLINLAKTIVFSSIATNIALRGQVVVGGKGWGLSSWGESPWGD